MYPTAVRRGDAGSVAIALCVLLNDATQVVVKLAVKLAVKLVVK